MSEHSRRKHQSHARQDMRKHQTPYLMHTAGTSIVKLYGCDDQGQGRGTKVEGVETDVHLEVVVLERCVGSSDE
jgi:hypothetical protein